MEKDIKKTVEKLGDKLKNFVGDNDMINKDTAGENDNMIRERSNEKTNMINKDTAGENDDMIQERSNEKTNMINKDTAGENDNIQERSNENKDESIETYQRNRDTAGENNDIKEEKSSLGVDLLFQEKPNENKGEPIEMEQRNRDTAGENDDIQEKSNENKEGEPIKMEQRNRDTAGDNDDIQEKSNEKKDEPIEIEQNKDDDENEQYLHTDPKTGLTTEEAEKRMREFGKNEITETKHNPVLKFISYFRGPIAYLIELACIVAAIVRDWIDFGIILALLVVNALIGFIEESRAESALEALKQSLALKTKALRDGKLVELDSTELVPGDIITLRIGNIIPADAKLLGVSLSGSESSEHLLVDQSALTGESLPVRRSKGEIVYSSSIVKQGQMLAIVSKTGKNTYIGRAATLMNMTVDQGHFQKIVNKIGNFLILITVTLVVIIFVYQVVKFRGTSDGNVLVVLQRVLVLTVAAIPVGLPTVLSVTMAVGAKQLAAKKVIIKRLAAVEELASVSVLCTDKTGTLTLNELSSDESWLSPPYTDYDLHLYAYICSEAGTDDAIELAVRNAAIKKVDILQNLKDEHDIPGFKVISLVPFNPSKKYSHVTVMHLETHEKFQIVKGAPQVIIKLTGGNRQADQAVINLASRGLRALGVARSKPITSSDTKTDSLEPEQLEWELVGFLSLLDPPRPDSREILKKCNELGLDIKMITGDQLIIAKEVSHRLGMGRVILDSNHLVDPTKSDEEVTEHCIRADGFAQVIPEHKYKVVELLQKKGCIGDGVNDAPALKRADVGIAVQGCTDAARSASDIVLLAPGLSTIIDGIMTSRTIFQRMRSYSLYRITSTVHFLLFFFCIILARDWTLPAVLLILIAMLNDAATLAISVDNTQISGGPDKWRIGQLITLSIILGIILTGFSFAHYFIFMNVIGVTPGHFWEVLPSPIFVLSILGTQVFAAIISGFGWLTESIGWVMCIVILAISLGIFVILDFVKVIVFHYWSFELTAKLFPSKARRAKLNARRERALTIKGINNNFRKMRKVLLLTRVIRIFIQKDSKEKVEVFSEK
ncbi:3743_t:CDS:10 [Scutellospora calospora]|uniref:3743_t:CDS:1 n=1 Tax=Scutellospora calospora TaxID=85575 RepID=A0ACA9LI09_9GLOM|nr:3743_t:CDS:10 [Scutellospora calospora]